MLLHFDDYKGKSEKDTPSSRIDSIKTAEPIKKKRSTIKPRALRPKNNYYSVSLFSHTMGKDLL